MKLIARFLPLIVFTVLSSLVNWRVGAFVALLTVVGRVVFVAPHRLGVLGAGMATFFAATSIVALAAPNADLRVALHPAAALWMALVSALSIAAGRPFTAEVAAEGQPAEVVSSPGFMAINRAITAAWAWAFLAIAAVSSVAAVIDAPVLATGFTVLVVLGALRYSMSYADRVVAAGSAA
ncbi:MAG TPA: hypothetical protein VGM93_01365 [Acidimicrobiales bacterium]